ncbi:MAG: PEP/pyruvate-binding domain-containing protein, partial [Desulfobacterales bacterium]
RQQDIARWLYARGELLLAQRLQALERSDALEAANGDLPQVLKTLLRVRRLNRHQETIADFDRQAFDGQTGFYRIGRGSMGGKARGLLLLASQLRSSSDWRRQFPQVDITVPGALVVATDVFDAFVETNGLQIRSRTQLHDEEIAARFLAAPLPATVIEDLEAYLAKVDHPLAVRSSSLLEDSLSRPYAGIYRTYMLPNDHSDRQVRLTELQTAIKLVYASTFFEEPRAFAKRTQQQPDEEKMAVVIQGLVGRSYGDLYLPAISGVVQSYNYYPMAPMQPEDGIASIAVGLGKAVVGGERALRFCPRYPQHLPQFSSVDDILDNAQRYYYGLKMKVPPLTLGVDADAHLVKREVGEDDPPDLMRLSAGTYLPEEHRIKDAAAAGGYPVITFAPLLKYDALPLAEILNELLDLGRRGLGRAVDIEFCLDFPADGGGRPQLSILQIRPMADQSESATVAIQDDDRKHAFCYSENALGNGVSADLTDIVYVKPSDFDPSKTSAIAKEIARMNAELVKAGRRYLLIGPGRWGSADPWLGIPVNWADISGAAVIVETTHKDFNADPSQGSHFFHNMTSLGMSYLNITAQSEDFIKPGWFASHPVMRVTRFLSHIRLERPVIVKVDGRSSRGILRDSR